MTVDRAKGVSFYFYAGDFAEAIRRHARSEQQLYGTHDEVTRLALGLRDAGFRVRMHSFVTPKRAFEEECGIEIVALGAERYDQIDLLNQAIADDPCNRTVITFPNLDLLKSATKAGKQVLVVIADSYNKPGIRESVRRWRLARCFNDKRVELVSNHCLPSTRHLASFGVDRTKLIPWDVPHRFSPHDHSPKTLEAGAAVTIAYAGSISVDKGVFDIVRGLASARQNGVDASLLIAGSGEVEPLRQVADALNVGSSVNLLGQVGNDRVFSLFRDADFVAIPSRHSFPEGFPLTMFEAIASRTPIICSDHPMFTPVTSVPDRAFVFPEAKPEEFARVLTEGTANPARYALVSNNAVDTWAALKGPADWRKLIHVWATEGKSAPWLQQHMLTNLSSQ